MTDSESFDGRSARDLTPSHLARLAGQQDGVVSTAQLLALGLTLDDVRGRVKSGLLIPWHRNVFAVGHRKLSQRARLLAALLTCGPTSFVSHRTAAAVWGLRVLNTRRIELTVPGASAPHRKQLVMHRTNDRMEKGDVAVRNGLRVSSVPRMLIELAPVESLKELERLITQAVRERILDLSAMEAALRRHTRRPGIGKLKQALRDYRPRPERKSSLEVAFDRLIAGTDIPTPQRNVWVDEWELDCYWPEHKLIVELDGRNYHTAVKDMERDRLKDTHFLLQGIGTMRITDLRFELEPAQILADLIRLTT